MKTTMDLGDLLTIMRRMHCAAAMGDWDQVDSLDGQRSCFLDQMTDDCEQNSLVDINICRAMISEIAELDQAVTDLLHQSLEWTAGQTPELLLAE